MHEAPVSRHLRVLAFDPSLTTKLETSTINELTLSIRWEELQPGPVGEYLEVVDYDPASGVFYEPVDLNHPYLLAQDGLAPSESNPQFHQQMTYAVAMTTIRQFERALGRVAFWADRTVRSASGDLDDQFVRRLRIYPHALRDRNAYYSPLKKALLFGYFPVQAKDKENVPGTLVFTCLSHDIIAHEVTHALLDGVHPRFNEASNPDVHAFHEAFADIVALLQHFSYPAVLESEIRKTRGNLHTENLLSQLAQQFGLATGRGAALRDALGKVNPATGMWEAQTPDPRALETTYAPHDRGAILVAAIFRAFLLIYRARTADLFRIATNGTGTLPAGEIHPDLTRRLAYEASKCADRVLQMCIRAIDYCPPVNITFGDFLRGVITADVEYVPEDEAGYRTVFIQSFREWGIHPRGILSMSHDALEWPRGERMLNKLVASQESARSVRRAEAWRAQLRDGLQKRISNFVETWNLETDRLRVWEVMKPLRAELRQWLRTGGDYGEEYVDIFGLVVDKRAPPTVYRKDGEPTIEVHAVRPAIRRTIHGSTRTDLVVEITQRRRGYFDRAEQEQMDQPGTQIPNSEEGDFTYRAGCTLLIDAATKAVRRIIRTPGNIADNVELDRVRRFLTGVTGDDDNAFDAGLAVSRRQIDYVLRAEPFALLHRYQEK